MILAQSWLMVMRKPAASRITVEINGTRRRLDLGDEALGELGGGEQFLDRHAALLPEGTDAPADAVVLGLGGSVREPGDDRFPLLAGAGRVVRFSPQHERSAITSTL